MARGRGMEDGAARFEPGIHGPRATGWWRRPVVVGAHRNLLPAGCSNLPARRRLAHPDGQRNERTASLEAGHSANRCVREAAQYEHWLTPRKAPLSRSPGRARSAISTSPELLRLRRLKEGNAVLGGVVGR